MDGRRVAPAAPDGPHWREAALATLDSLGNDRISCCPHCQATRVLRWGKGRSGVQRWRCSLCERSFSAATGSLLAGVHARDKLRLVLLDMVSERPSSCRQLAAALTLSAMTIWNWRQRVNRVFALMAGPHEAPAGAIATTVIRESRKASREWVDHQRDPARHPRPDRLRWVDYRERRLPLPNPMTPFLLAVRLLEVDHGHWRATLVPPPCLVKEQAGWSLAGGATIPPSLAATHGVARCGGPGASDVDTIVTHLRAFLRPFCGPAKQHLGGYAAWFVAWHSADKAARRRALAERAWRLLARCDQHGFVHGYRHRSV